MESEALPRVQIISENNATVSEEFHNILVTGLTEQVARDRRDPVL